jgi:hypothetical protein
MTRVLRTLGPLPELPIASPIGASTWLRVGAELRWTADRARGQVAENLTQTKLPISSSRLNGASIPQLA